jgi:hypothetical protein
MKKIIHKIASILMAFVVLLSTMSFTISMHYCGDTLVETAIFHEAKGCGMEMEKPSSKNCAIIKKGCCNDEQVEIDGQDELQLQVDTISLEQQIFLTSIIHAYYNLFEGLSKNISSYEDYEPPLVRRQLFKIDESYLI